MEDNQSLIADERPRSMLTYENEKRALDIVLCSMAIVVLFPVLLGVAIAVRVTSPGPIIHWSKRIGRNNTVFLMAKFRTMHMDTPQLATHLMTDPAAHLTPIGGLLRRTSLDELPQLYNILRGQIALVGPRPALFNQDDLIAQRTAANVHRLTPGLTGWAQVCGRDELSIPEKVDLDRFYLEHRSFGFDLKVLALTAVKVLRGEGVVH